MIYSTFLNWKFYLLLILQYKIIYYWIKKKKKKKKKDKDLIKYLYTYFIKM